MRVVILGEDAPGGLMASYARGFGDLGADVRTFCLARTYASVMPAVRTRVLRRLAEPVLLAAFNEQVIRELRGAEADLVFVIKGQRLDPVTVDRLRLTTGAPVVNFYPDDPFSRVRSNALVYGDATLAAYDACFTFARHLMPQYTAAGARAVHYLPFARDPFLHAPRERRATVPEHDVVFVGNLDEDRVACLEALARSYRVAVFGERTRRVVNRRSPLARATFGPPAYGRDLTRALARGAIALNVMRPQNAGSHNMRSFESPACGAFTLTQRTPELLELFADGEEVVTFGSVAELCELTAEWLRADADRSRIAAAGHARVRDDTYTRRAAAVLDAVGVASLVAS